MKAVIGFDFSGVSLRLQGVPSGWATRIRNEWSGFIAEPGIEAFLDLDVCTGYGELPTVADFDPKRMGSRLDTDRASFVMPEGRLDLALDGKGRLSLAGSGDDHAYYALMNLVRAAIAWVLPSRGGVLLHAAGIEVEGRAFLLVGPEGSGKTTWARLAEEGGAHVISDDLLIVDGTAPRLEVPGAPLYSRHKVRHRRGRWPLAAVLFPEHGAPVGCAPVSALRTRARLTANLPFIAEAIYVDERIAPVLDRIVEQVPCLELTFGLDPEFLQSLRELEDPR